MKVFFVFVGVFILTWTGVSGRIFRAPEPVAKQAVDHECVRECSWPSRPKTCRYVFTVEWLESMSAACFDCPFNMTDCDRPGCIPINGYQRPIVTVNRQFPGPPIEVCEDDEVVVKVWNRLGSESTTIHWHGLHQRNTQHMDGAPMITQCPISPQSSFTYKFKATPSGTHWWHSHSGVQSHDGVFGAFVIKQTPKRNVHSDLYDYDLPEHVVLVMDWLHEPTITDAASVPPRTSHQDTLIINGKGMFTEFSKDGKIAYTPREVFNVKHGGRYRFRVIGNNFCHVYVSVQDHNLTVIATDGVDIKPMVVDRIGVAAGERYDFVLTADKDVKNYWFLLGNSGGPCASRVQEGEYAILRYDGAPEEEPTEVYTDDINEGVYLNRRSEFETPDGLDIDQVEAIVPADDRLLGEPDHLYYMAVGINRVARWGMYDLGDYPSQRLSEFARPTRQLNYVSFKTPPSPLLTQLHDVPKEEFCDADEALDARDDCLGQFCTCIQMIKVDLGQMVEIVFVAEDGFGVDHPMHLHGFTFRVVAMGKLPRGTTIRDVMQLDRQGNITRKFEYAVEKDTVQVQGDGYTVIRFIADNPGWWFMHCHKIFHVIDGMTIVVQVGDQSDLPPVPKNFPRCGSWSVEDEDDGYGDDKDDDVDNNDDATDDDGYEKERKKGTSRESGNKQRKKTTAE